jgi:hypothetical protein
MPVPGGAAALVMAELVMAELFAMTEFVVTELAMTDRVLLCCCGCSPPRC